MSKALPKITRTQRADAFTLHHKYVRVRYKSLNDCLHCGNHWKADNSAIRETGKGKCPKCKQVVHSIDAPKNTPFNYQSWWEDRKVYGIIDTYEGYQLVRLFMSVVDMAKGRKRKHNIRELAQHWIDDTGMVKSIYVGNSGSFYNITWGYGELAFRGGSTASYKYGEEPHKFWKVKRFIPTLRRNGIQSSIHNISANKLFVAILKNPKVETLFKAKFFGLVRAFIYNDIDLDKNWDSIKILIRNNYKVDADKWREWSDYLDDLDFFNLDLRNAMYVCPENLHEAHKALASRRRLVEDENAEMERIEQKANQKIGYVTYFKKYFGLKFTDGDIAITPLKSRKEFRDCGHELEHCVGAYHTRRTSIVFKAKMKRELLETIEVSLTDFKVLQARGYDNKPSEHNGKIIKLVEKNLSKIRKLKQSA